MLEEKKSPKEPTSSCREWKEGSKELPFVAKASIDGTGSLCLTRNLRKMLKYLGLNLYSCELGGRLILSARKLIFEGIYGKERDRKDGRMNCFSKFWAKEWTSGCRDLPFVKDPSHTWLSVAQTHSTSVIFNLWFNNQSLTLLKNSLKPQKIAKASMAAILSDCGIQSVKPVRMGVGCPKEGWNSGEKPQKTAEAADKVASELKKIGLKGENQRRVGLFLT